MAGLALTLEDKNKAGVPIASGRPQCLYVKCAWFQPSGVLRLRHDRTQLSIRGAVRSRPAGPWGPW